LVVVGHSLGSSLAIELLLDFTNEIDELYAYNLGIGFKRFFSEIFKKINCNIPIINKSDFCKKQKSIKNKLKTFTTIADPISILSIVHGASVVKPSRINPHSSLNFTRVEL
jgi:hypothetical protein